jgi:heat shock protein HslJ
MKKKILVLTLFAVWILGCNSTLRASAIREDGTNDRSAPNSSTITGKEWKLIEVRINDSDTGFNRDILIREGFDQFFTVNFDTDIVSGTGAPNRYSAPYTLGDNQSINIMTMRSTMMASFFQPENRTEHDFFTYMQNSYEWKLVNNNLELQSKTADGNAVLLVFSL